MLKFNSFVICTENAEALQKFYTEVFQMPIDEMMMGWSVGGMYVAVMAHSEVKGKNKDAPRIMFNLETADVKSEFDRIKAIAGAEVIKEPYQMDEWDGWIATIADPDGNYFQLMSPWDGNSK